MLLVICEINEPPKLYEHDKLPEPPDGCTGYMAVQHSSGVKGLILMPVNEFRPETERLSDYLAAMSYGRTYMSYGKLENLEENISGRDDRETLLSVFTEHASMFMELVARQAVELGLTKEMVNAICNTAFGHAHDQVCPDPTCVSAMHKRVFGGKGMN